MLRLIRLTESDEGTDPIVKAVLDAYGDRLTQDEAVRLSTDVKRYVKELIRSKEHAPGHGQGLHRGRPEGR